MKESTKLLVIVIMSLIWALATLFATANNSLKTEDPIELYMVLAPFLAFFGSLLIYHSKYKSEQIKE